MVELDMIILGALIGGPAHGYQLKQNIEASFGKRFVKLSNSSLYPRLTKLEAKGCIEGRKEQKEKGPDRIVYSITPAGFQRMKELVATPLGPREDEFDFMSHAAFFGMLTTEERRKVTGPFYRAAQQDLEDARKKREQFGKFMDKYSLAVLDSGIEMIEHMLRLYKQLMDE